MIGWIWAGERMMTGLLVAPATSAMTGGGTGAAGALADPDAAEMVWLTLGYAAPVLIAPLVVLGLRPLYALFLREGAELFTETYLDPDLFRAVGHYMAIINVILFILTWEVCFVCQQCDRHHLWTCLVVVVGVLGALGITVRLVGKGVGLHGRRAFLVGLVMFGGGNLPLFVAVPTVMALV